MQAESSNTFREFHREKEEQSIMTCSEKMKASMVKQLRMFDFVCFSVPDMHGTPKGRLVPSCVMDQACRDGVSIFSGTQCLGVQSEIPNLPEFNNFPNANLQPIPGMVQPLLWSTNAKQRIGHVMCEMHQLEKGVSKSCPRYAALQQVQRLADKGYKIKSAFEVEFDILETKTMEPLGGQLIPYANMNLLDHHLDFFGDMLKTLHGSGIALEYFFPEYQGGQYELSMQPQWGVTSADHAFMCRFGIKAFCNRHDLTATFMALPYSHFHSAGFHFNHSLWTEGGVNLFHDSSDPEKLSSTARHWMAGLLHHAPALAALCCPTVNCYRRLHIGFAPGKIFWDHDSRLSAIRAKTTQNNVFLENRIPSSACNPYLTVAATIAAGLDGVERKLTCPPVGSEQKGQELKNLPKSLEEALDCLERDTVLREALGGTVAEYFIAVKRDFELEHFKKVITKDMDVKEQVEKEREYYMTFI